ncbi:MAG: HAD-IA family hydrolase [Gammaproteobacteria bacterium]|nr:HAD-IA family hydrolase [Gammaproteobacteria bacterium]
MNESLKAILWDFGGVFTSSPFEAFAKFERVRGLPENFIRSVNSRNIEANAWAQLESNKITRTEFDELFRLESEKLGHSVKGEDVLSLLAGEVRPRMVSTLAECKRHYRVGCITNNMKPAAQVQATPEMVRNSQTAEIMGMFDTIVESSVEGVRKPEPQIYKIACDRLGCQPGECVFLDDLGINLKTARAMGMITIKVVDPDEAIQELEIATGLSFP